MSRRSPVDEAPPESDRLPGAPHPRETERLFGHVAAEAEFLTAYREARLPQAWLIGGREGIGKATLAWRVARFVLANPDPRLPAVQCATDLHVDPNHPAARRIVAQSHADVALLRREWDPKTKKHFTEIRIDDVRKAIDLFHRAASEGGWRVAIVDCAEDLNKSSANALLKIIEEPPPKSLFLIVAHRPAATMPTIRSRCRLLVLSPLADADVIAAIRAMGEDAPAISDKDLQAAAVRASGSVRDAMLFLESASVGVADDVERLLSLLPEVDWRAVHALADATQGREGGEVFEAVMTLVYDWIDGHIRRSATAGASPRSLAPLAQVWEKIAASARETQALNLDRRPLVLTMFADLAAAVSADRG
ncbi:MAG: DNA polymerase III subunit delta' [Beijerinckiaceae bacterium]